MKRKLYRTVFERIKESKWKTSCKYENQTFLKYKSYPLYSDFASKTLFSLESINCIKIKITHQIVIGYGCMNVTYECLLSQSVF